MIEFQSSSLSSIPSSFVNTEAESLLLYSLPYLNSNLILYVNLFFFLLQNKLDDELDVATPDCKYISFRYRAMLDKDNVFEFTATKKEADEDDDDMELLAAWANS